MLIRRQVYFSVQDENGEERLYSVNEKKEKTAGDKVKTAGKVALGAGTAVGLSGGIGENVMLNKTLNKVAEKTGATRIGFNKIMGSSPKQVNETIDRTKRILNRSKAFKIAKRADTLGLTAAGLGAGAIVAGKVMNKNKKKDNK